ncbi:MAG: 16S rRNA (cytosine(1402)-N(4))-methyltransferase RsmH [Nitrospiraceae bacterium]|nr:16S rRNA (cytosine(1402)-N(4))-methyltransferase RsmH [Nitrospiraceae bacterium]
MTGLATRNPVHRPVLVGEAMDILRPEAGGVYVDATVGLGGHAGEMLRLMGGRGTLIGIDRDEEALRMAAAALTSGNVVLRHAGFSRIGDVLGELRIESVKGIFFDLGVSMLQLKMAGRGFSFATDEPLDMRMDITQALTAREVVNTYSQERLTQILREYGEERHAAKIARAIVTNRRQRPIGTCRELARIAAWAYGRAGRQRIHPATRTFQALRIEVNRELDELEAGLGSSVQLLSKGGRMAVISYHSLEDRIVKHFFKKAAAEGQLQVLTKKPVRPGPEEVRENPAARSARLRGAEKL